MPLLFCSGAGGMVYRLRCGHEPSNYVLRVPASRSGRSQSISADHHLSATMSTKVYVWKSEGDNGHASMELSDGTYISWWPLQGGKAEQGGSKDLAFPKQTVDTDQSGEERDTVLKQTVETGQPCEGKDLVQKHTLDNDVQDKGRNPDLVFVVPSKVDLKEDDIKSWWENIETKDEYNLCNNCYGAVKHAVEAGGAKADESFTETQGGLIKYMEEMRKMNWEPPQNRIKLCSVM